jgi:voltage-gated potassium channel
VKEIVLRGGHPWNGQKIRELDISRQTYIVMVDRGGKMIKPDPDVVLEEGDKILVYTKESINKYMRESLI